MTLATSSSAPGSLKILAVDTSGGEGSLAYAEVNQTAEERFEPQNIQQVSWNKKATHSELITVQLKNLLQQTGTNTHDLTHLSVNAGPGSFTGIRVGLSLARTLAYALHRPIVTLDRLSLLAARVAQRDQKIFIALKAVQNYFYCAGFERTMNGITVIFPHQSLEESEISAHSKGFHRTLVEGSEPNFNFETQAREHFHYLALSPGCRAFSSWKQVKPLYIRASEAEEKLRRGLLKPL